MSKYLTFYVYIFGILRLKTASIKSPNLNNRDYLLYHLRLMNLFIL